VQNVDDTNFQNVHKKCLKVPYVTLHMSRAIVKSEKKRTSLDPARIIHLPAVFFLPEFLEDIKASISYMA
jgi:hypothetical protein